MQLPPKSFYQSLPSKRMAAGVLFINNQEQILLVEPTYKSVWEIPGGTVEINESPRQGAEREILEELGLSCSLQQLLCLDYVPEDPNHTESLQFIFWGGLLSPEQIAQIQLPAGELRSFEFKALDQIESFLQPRLYRRILQAWQALQSKQFKYLEAQLESQSGIHYL